jgi:integrase
MKGTVYKRVLPSGTVAWAVSVDAGRDETGKRKRIFKSGFERKSDADIELGKILGERNDGSLVRPDPRTFAEFSEAWLSEHAEISCAPKTAERYREMLAHVTRQIGAQPLGKVTTLQLQRVYNQLLKSGKKDGTGHSIKTVRNIHGVVHVALETAVAWGLLKLNPASRCKLPPAPKREAAALDFSQARRLLESSADPSLADFLGVDMACGARRGEMLALTWQDIGPEYCAVTIHASLEQTEAGLRLKGTKGNNIRTVTLPQDAIEALKRVKVSQDETRAMYGTDYRSDLDLVFCDPDGNYIRPDTVTKAVRRIAKKVGFSRVSLHTLRHSNGSQLLSAGVPLAVVSKRLGHTDVYTTARIYSHALESDASAAAEKWEQAMQRTANSKVIAIEQGKKPRASGVVANGSTELKDEQKVTEAKSG